MVQINDLKERVADRYDPCEFIELLKLNIHDLMEAFEDEMMEHLDELFDVGDLIEGEEYGEND